MSCLKAIWPREIQRQMGPASVYVVYCVLIFVFLVLLLLCCSQFLFFFKYLVVFLLYFCLFGFILFAFGWPNEIKMNGKWYRIDRQKKGKSGNILFIYFFCIFKKGLIRLLIEKRHLLHVVFHFIGRRHFVFSYLIYLISIFVCIVFFYNLKSFRSNILFVRFI